MDLKTLFFIAAGACDATTGAALIVAPSLVLGALAIPVAPAGTAYLRFVGVFVACVGLAYVYPWCFPRGAARDTRLAIVIELTALVRLAVALFVGVSVVAGVLARPWTTVAMVDLVLAAIQLSLRPAMAFRHVH